MIATIALILGIANLVLTWMVVKTISKCVSEVNAALEDTDEEEATSCQ